MSVHSEDTEYLFSLLRDSPTFENTPTFEKNELPKKNLFNNIEEESIYQFQKNTLDNNKILIIGPRDSGKTVLIKDLIIELQDSVEEIHYISFGLSDEIFPFRIYKGIEEFDIEKYLKYLKYVKNKNKDNNKYKTMLIFDNSIFKNSLEDKFLNELIFHSKYYNIILIISMQFPMGLSPEFRNTIDTIFLFNNHTISNEKRLYDHYCGMFPNFEIFKKYYNKITQNHGTMVIDQTRDGYDITDMIYDYRVNNINDNLLDKNKFIKNKYEKNTDNIINIKILKERITELEERIEKLENDLNSRNNNTIYI
jgi:hypothetical protein